MSTRNSSAVWLDKQQRWQIKVQVNGVRKSFTSAIPGRAGKAEANRKADEWLALELIDTSSTVATAWDKWMDTLTSKIMVHQARSFYKNYISLIANKKLCTLTVGDLQAVIDKAAKKGLAKKSLSDIRTSMAAFIKWSRKNRYTPITCEDVSIPKNAPEIGKKILQPDDLKKLFAYHDDLYANLFKLGALTGMRPGELVGLQWDDISGDKISVRRAINYKNEITAGKNSNARRTVRIGKYEQAVIADQRSALKRRHIISPWMFPRPDGEHAVQVNVAYHWRVLCTDAGIAPGITPYGLRHTFVSVTSGMPDGIKKRRVGHSQNMDTEGIYGHHIEGDERAETEYLESRFDELLGIQKPTQ